MVTRRVCTSKTRVWRARGQGRTLELVRIMLTGRRGVSAKHDIAGTRE